MSSHKILIFSTGLALLPLMAAVVNYKYINGFLWPLFIYLISSFASESLNLIFEILDIDVVIIYNIYSILEFVLLSVFYSVFFKPYFKPLIFYINIIAFTIFSIVAIKPYGSEHANNISMAIEGILLTCYSLFWFYFILKNLLYEDLLKTPVFWINTAVLFYFGGNLIIFIFSSYIAKHMDGNFHMLWGSIHTFFNILLNVFFIIGFWKIRSI